jgi:hypothetical protein
LKNKNNAYDVMLLRIECGGTCDNMIAFAVMQQGALARVRAAQATSFPMCGDDQHSRQKRIRYPSAVTLACGDQSARHFKLNF